MFDSSCSALFTSPAAVTRGLPGGVLLDHVGHHGDGGVDPGAGGGGPRVTRAPGAGAGGGRGHPVLRLSGHVNEEPPHAVCCHGCDDLLWGEKLDPEVSGRTKM